MDNAAFRSLVTSDTPRNDSAGGTFKKPAALGSRARSSIPMTPRNVPGYNPNREFARQVAEHSSSSSEPPLKKFKSSAAPKGSKFGQGYVDRAQLRQKDEDELRQDVDKETRLKNLEEQLKLGQIEQTQFEQLRDQIGVGGDVQSTHLVKGLDWKLLGRIRRGEDVNQTVTKDDDLKRSDTEPELDVDDELERALEKEVVAIDRDEKKAQEESTQETQEVLTRDEILRRFREQRHGPPTTAVPVLNERFKKVAASEKSGKKKYVESVNGRRREVLVITNRDGTTKRKTRWIDPEDSLSFQQPLGMEVPAEIAAKQKAILDAQAAEDDNEDIFADAGDDYNPLAGIESGSEESTTRQEHDEPAKAETANNNNITTTKRNYFSAGTDAADDATTGLPISNDPTIFAALKRAAQIRQHEEGSEGVAGDLQRSGDNPNETAVDAKSSAFLAKLKEREKLDDADLDYGFGESRFGDDDDDEEAGPLYDGEEGEQKKSGRKRGPKKRKGNKDNVQDVMSVLEGRNKNR